MALSTAGSKAAKLVVKMVDSKVYYLAELTAEQKGSVKECNLVSKLVDLKVSTMGEH